MHVVCHLSPDSRQAVGCSVPILSRYLRPPEFDGILGIYMHFYANMLSNISLSVCNSGCTWTGSIQHYSQILYQITLHDIGKVKPDQIKNWHRRATRCNAGVWSRKDADFHGTGTAFGSLHGPIIVCLNIKGRDLFLRFAKISDSD